MRRFLIIILCILSSTFAGLYTRPSYILIGQLNWMDVVTKGYFLSTIPKFFTQGMIDDSFFWVLRFCLGGVALGLIVSILASGGNGLKTKKKKS